MGVAAKAPESEIPDFVLADPEGWLAELDRKAAECSLLEFIQLLWRVLEPETPFLKGWALECMCEHLEAVSRGEIKRLVINIVPGAMKSLLVDTFWPMYEWGPCNCPHLRYLSASYAQKLTIRNNRYARQLIQSDIYQSNWGSRFTIDKDQDQKEKFSNNHRGFKMASSVGGTITGDRGHRFILDDPHSVQGAQSERLRDAAAEFFSTTVPTRVLQGDTSAIIVMMQRLHARDITGLILSNELDYTMLRLPMMFEERNRCFTQVNWQNIEPEIVTLFRRDGDPLPRYLTDVEVIDEINQFGLPSPDWEPHFKEMWPQDRRTKEGELLWEARFPKDEVFNELIPQLEMVGGDLAVSGQLQQRPAPQEGAMFKTRDFLIENIGPSYIKCVRAWDLAASTGLSSAWSVGVKMVWIKGHLWIVDVIRKRVTPDGLENLILQCAISDGMQCEQYIPQDPGGAGLHQRDAIALKLTGHNFKFHRETGSKQDRAIPFSAKVESGHVHLVKGSWNDAYLAEITQFPNGEYLDQVDATSSAFKRQLELNKRRHRIAKTPMSVNYL